MCVQFLLALFLKWHVLPSLLKKGLCLLQGLTNWISFHFSKSLTFLFFLKYFEWVCPENKSSLVPANPKRECFAWITECDYKQQNGLTYLYVHCFFKQSAYTQTVDKHTPVKTAEFCDIKDEKLFFQIFTFNLKITSWYYSKSSWKLIFSLST